MSEHYKILDHDTKYWKLPQESSYFTDLKKEDQVIINKLLNTFDIASENELINYTYDNYPYFSINSKRKINSSQDRKIIIEKSKLTLNNEKRLFSIGYEGKSIDAYLNNVITNNIKLLCDVRRNPLSMKYGFSKSQLSTLCNNLGIKYIHIPELGIASEDRTSLNNMDDYTKLFAKYNSGLSQLEQHISEVINLLNTYSRIALTCFETSHLCCHRGTLINYILCSILPLTKGLLAMPRSF